MFFNNSANVWYYADVVQITRCQPPYPQQTFISGVCLAIKVTKYIYIYICSFKNEEEIGICWGSTGYSILVWISRGEFWKPKQGRKTFLWGMEGHMHACSKVTALCVHIYTLPIMTNIDYVNHFPLFSHWEKTAIIIAVSNLCNLIIWKIAKWVSYRRKLTISGI